jgi:MerR family transcriptional regulator, light-induced transcriptional regulator
LGTRAPYCKGEVFNAKELIREARAARLRRSDLLIGILQPALYEIGRLWETGEITVAQEHLFTARCEEALALLEGQSSDASDPETILTTVEGSLHTIGVRFLGFHLQDLGYRAGTLIPGLPNERIVAL